VAHPDEATPVLLLLVLAERHFADALQEHLVAAGFDDHRAVHHRVMAHVTHEGIRLTDLAERAGVTKQAMSELVADLEALGYLQRSADPRDGRAKLIGFTDKGRAAVTAAMRAFERMEGALDVRSLRGLRRGLLAALETDLAPDELAAASRQLRRPSASSSP
jgi:DNA-binding MarR family transcriptional regulator